MKKIAILILSILVVSCGKNDDPNPSTINSDSEMSQQLGSAMSGIDESGGSGGAYAFYNSGQKMFARLGIKGDQPTFFNKAYAATCGASTFNSCTNNVITRIFSGCTVGNATFTGDITITFDDGSSDNTCLLTTNGHTITRAPNFQMTGRGGLASLNVALATGATGQQITKTGAGTFDFTNDGIRRTFTLGSSTLVDFTTQTTSAVAVTGNSRNGRQITGGTLRVTNNKTNEVCDWIPTNVTWNDTCTCAISGTWNASCTGGADGNRTGSVVLGSSCGSALVTMDGTSQNVTFDRCSVP